MPATPVGELSSAYRQLAERLQSHLLPHWSRALMDDRTGAGFPALRPDGTGERGAPRQVSTAAELIYAFARGEHLGLIAGLHNVVRRLMEYVSAHATDVSRSDGYAHLLSPAGDILDPTYHTMDHALFMQSGAAVYAAYGKGAELRRTYNILKWLDRCLAHPEGGWRESSASAARPLTVQLQMLQAFLFIYRMQPKPSWLERAAEVVELIERQYLADGWLLADPGGQRASQVRLQLRAVAQLHKFAALAGQKPLPAVRNWYDHAAAHCGSDWVTRVALLRATLAEVYSSGDTKLLRVVEQVIAEFLTGINPPNEPWRLIPEPSANTALAPVSLLFATVEAAAALRDFLSGGKQLGR